jgi:putative ABC transport system substrate-binding protein
MAGKWLELLTEIAPAVKRVTIIFNPDTASRGGSYYLPSFEAAARTLKVEPIIARVHGDAEIETVINSLRREPGSGPVVMTDARPPLNKGAPAAPGDRLPAGTWLGGTRRPY